jgi:hypothetical protein
MVMRHRNRFSLVDWARIAQSENRGNRQFSALR